MGWSPLLVGIVLVGLVVLAVFLCLHSDRKQDYDERQLQIRAKAYRLGFFTMIVSMLAVMFLQGWEKWNSVVDNAFGILAALLFSLTVFGVYCVLNDAYFTRRENPKASLLFCFGVLIMNIGAVLTNLSDDRSIFVDGKLTFSPGGNLLCVGMFGVFTLTLLIKMLIKPKEDDE
ncbi:MAG: hypothetical protein IKI15_04570 [Lachnospiraceae bacterium]|nr:hypothetical protein [Lachnospiraceae bacterium]